MATKQWLCAALISGFAVGCASGDDDGNVGGAGGFAGSMVMQPSTGAGIGAAGMMAPPTQTPVGMAGMGTSGVGGAVMPPATSGAGGAVIPPGMSGAGGAAGGDVAGMGGMAGGAAGMAGNMMAGMGGAAGMAGMAGGPPTTPSCLDGLMQDFAKDDGPFKYAAKHANPVKIWVPELPAGCKAPIVHVANGTGATCSAYQATINRLASFGFLVTCYENTNTGAGTQGITAIKKVMENHKDMFAKAVGSTGHSQGGQAAFVVHQFAEKEWGSDPEYKFAGLAMQPASGFGSQPAGGWQNVYGMIKGPMFMFSGTSDALVSQAWVTSGFRALADSVEAYHWSAVGSAHIPTPQNEAADVAVPWFRWKLLGDKVACKRFFDLKTTPGKTARITWREVASQNPKTCD